MKGFLAILSLVSLFFALAYQLFILGNLNLEKAEKNSQKLNDFNFSRSSGKPFTKYDLLENRPIVLMYMDPSCEACEVIIEQMFQHIDEFDPVHLIFATEADVSHVMEFSTKYNLEDFENIDIVLDRNEWLFKEYFLTETPSFIIFDAEHNLVKLIDEYAKLSIVVKYVRQSYQKKSKEDV